MCRLILLTLFLGLQFFQVGANAQERGDYSLEELDSLRVHYGVFYSLDSALNHREDVKFLNLEGFRFHTFPEQVLSFPNLWGVRLRRVHIYYSDEELEELKIKLINDVFTEDALDKYRQQGYKRFVYVRDRPLKTVLMGKFNGIPIKLLKKMSTLKKLEHIDLEGTQTMQSKVRQIKKHLPNVTVFPDEDIDD